MTSAHTERTDAQRAENRTFLITIVSAFLFKLWLTSETRIIGVFAPHDHYNYIEHAKSISMGLWFGHYDQYTLIKVPFFPRSTWPDFKNSAFRSQSPT